MKEHPILFSTPMVRANLQEIKTITRRVVTKYNSSFSGTFGGWPSLDFSNAYVDGNRNSIDAIEYLHVPNPEWGTTHRIFPKYNPKDILWVRETFANGYNGCLDPNIGKEEKDFTLRYWLFKDGSQKYSDGSYFPDTKQGNEPSFGNVKWKPSIFMPREACRLRLEIQSIGVERLQDITEEDAIKEGIEPDPLGPDSIDGGVQYPGLRFYNYAKVGYRYVRPLESFQSLWVMVNGRESWDANPWVWRIEYKKL